MGHTELRQFLQSDAGQDPAEVADESEKERQKRLIRERALRLKSLAARQGTGRNVSIEQLEFLHPFVAIQLLGLPQSVFADEMRLAALPLPRLPVAGESVKKAKRS